MSGKQTLRKAEKQVRIVPWAIKTIQWFLAGMIFLQFVTAAILWIIATLRKRTVGPHCFPTLDFTEVQVGKNTLQLYCYGQTLFDDMLAAIDQAHETIYLESFIWKGDEVGEVFKEHLGQKAAEGVEVYVIFDSFGNLVVPRSFKSSFHPKIHVLEYQFVGSFWHILDPRRYALDHRKILAVDGKIGFIGGYNIGSLYATSWRDTHLRIVGPEATDLAQSVIDFWNRATPPRKRITRRYQRQFEPQIGLWGNDALRLTFPIRDMYIENIDRAERNIWLTNAYFVPDHVLLDSLKAAAKRGVDVRILVPWNSNHIIVDWVTHGYFSECLQAGIRVFGYQYTMLHAKTCTIDGEWTTVGTANLDRLSSIGNFEINAEIYSKELAQQMQALFECDTTEVFEVTLENWHNRPLIVKTSERILAPLRFIL
jgi:cardiolipin synthase